MVVVSYLKKARGNCIHYKKISNKFSSLSLNRGVVEVGHWRVMKDHLILACVASVSNRVTARKYFFLLSSQLSRRTREETLATQATSFTKMAPFF